MDYGVALRKLSLIAIVIIIILLAVFYVPVMLAPFVPTFFIVITVFLILLGSFILTWYAVGSD